MEIEKFLTQEKATLVKRWLDLVLETYHPETAKILKRDSNQFANPVGHAFHEGLSGTYEEFLRGSEPEKITPFLDKIIRIRAIQDFTPSQAVSFIFFLKQIIREELGGKENWRDRVSDEELQSFDSRVDALALLAFDVYAHCREKLYELKVNEVKQRTYRLLQRANLLEEIPEWKPEAGDTIL